MKLNENPQNRHIKKKYFLPVPSDLTGAVNTSQEINASEGGHH